MYAKSCRGTDTFASCFAQGRTAADERWYRRRRGWSPYRCVRDAQRHDDPNEGVVTLRHQHLLSENGDGRSVLRVKTVNVDVNRAWEKVPPLTARAR